MQPLGCVLPKPRQLHGMAGRFRASGRGAVPPPSRVAALHGALRGALRRLVDAPPLLQGGALLALALGGAGAISALYFDARSGALAAEEPLARHALPGESRGQTLARLDSEAAARRVT